MAPSAGEGRLGWLSGMSSETGAARPRAANSTKAGSRIRAECRIGRTTLTEGVSFNTNVARGEWGIVGLAIPILRRSTWASRAAAASVGGFPLLAVLVYVADEHPAAVAGAG